MESITNNVYIKREPEEEPKKVTLSFENNAFPEIELSEKSTNDLRTFFNAVFDYIITNEKMIVFQLSDKGTDLFKEVADDIIDQLNSEIKQSEENFEDFIELQLIDDTEEE